ncbi:MAG: hypothetical protein JWR48_3184 [Mycobacterium sp.]|nr:hypothetical protein [Mycobacterium sp.]
MIGGERVGVDVKIWVVDVALMSMSCGQGGDLGKVVGEDPLSGPGFRSFEVVQAGSVTSVSAFEGADRSFASGSPFDGSAECSAVLEVLAGGAGSALARDDDRAHTEVGQRGVDGGLAVAAVSGHRPRGTTMAFFDPSHRGSQLWCVRRVSDPDVVIEHNTVVVVDELRLIAELDRFTGSSDLAGVWRDRFGSCR